MKKNKSRNKPRDLLSGELLYFSDDDVFTVRDACEGALILGGVGSGKSSGSGNALARAYLEADFGFLVLCAKVDERARWQQYAKETGREDDLVIISAESGICFNLLSYMFGVFGKGAGIENIVTTILDACEVANRGGGSGAGEEGFWRNAKRSLLRNALLPLSLCKDISFSSLISFIRSAPRTPEQAKSREWAESSFFFACIEQVRQVQKGLSPDDPLYIDIEESSQYWFLEFAAMNPRTQQSVMSDFLSTIEPFSRGMLRTLFSTTTDILLEDVFDGKILVLDFPVKDWLSEGVFIQGLLKRLFQQAAERRVIKDNTRPAVLWCDELQNFTDPYDIDFLSTSRSARVCTVYITQNISNIYATLGSDAAGRSLADSLMANLSLKIFHANNDGVTNKWAADLIGQEWKTSISYSHSQNPDTDLLDTIFGFGGGGNSSASISKVYKYKYEAHEFATLLKGGDKNDYIVEAVIVSTNRWKASNSNWLVVSFSQC